MCVLCDHKDCGGPDAVSLLGQLGELAAEAREEIEKLEPVEQAEFMSGFMFSLLGMAAVYGPRYSDLAEQRTCSHRLEQLMSELVPATDIERIVGSARHPTLHQARAVSAEEKVYVLHSAECLVAHVADLRLCPFSLALDRGIDIAHWTQDKSFVVVVVKGYLFPLFARPGTT